jgi:hypothetical protein
MTRRRFALIFGIVLLLFGIAGFVPQLLHRMHPEFPPLMLDARSGELLALFPVNVLLDIVHILLGVWGLVACRRAWGARLYARGVGIACMVLALAGFIPGFLNGFGLLPLYSNNIWLHGVMGLVASYFGWLRRDPVRAIVIV